MGNNETPSGPTTSSAPKWWTKLLGGLAWTNGIAEPSLGARAPMIQQNLKASDLALSTAWIGWPIGMWSASTIAGRLVERLGARVVTFWGGLLYFAPFTLLGHASNIPTFLILMFFVGAGNGFFDAGWVRLANHVDSVRGANGRIVQRLNGFFSLGSIMASLLGLALVWLGVPLTWHLAGVAIVAVVALFWARLRLPNPGATDAEVGTEAVAEAAIEHGPRVKAPRRVRFIAVIWACVALPVGVGYVWSSIYLTRQGASQAVAVTGLIAFTLSETFIRFAVSKYSAPEYADRFPLLQDNVRLARRGATIAFIGVLLMVVPQTLPTTVLGLALLAGGLAPIGPIVQTAAQNAWPEHQGRAAAMVTRYGYTALVAGPAIIGPLSTLLGPAAIVTPLRIALSCIAVLPLIVIALSHYLRPAQPETVAA